MAPQVGLEPTTTRLTAECSAIELLRIISVFLIWPYMALFGLTWPYMTLYDVGEAVPHFSNFSLESGDVLLSRAVASQVPSALRGLTSVFGMGTGGSLSLLSPEIFSRISSFPHPHLHNCTAPYSIRVSSLRIPSFSFSRQAARLSPRPISIIKLHALPHFHR